MGLMAGELKQRGAALITALLFVALATVAATYMVKRQYFDIRQTSNIVSIDSANMAAMAAESWAISFLAQDLENEETKNYDDFAETEKRKEGLSSPYGEDGTLTGKIFDLQGRFNINNMLVWDKDQKKLIIDKDQVAIFKRLIENINKSGDPTEPDYVEIPIEIVEKLVDWIDEDTDQTGQGGEDDIYAGMPIPHKTPNNLIASTSEILLLEGIWDETNKTAIFNRLEPFISALPQRTPINFNVSSKELIAAMVDGISITDAEGIASDLENEPKEKPAEIVKAFKELKLFQGKEKKNNDAKAALAKLEKEKMFEVMTEYFQIEIQAEVAGVIGRLKSQVRRRKKDGYIFVYARGRGSI
ncbi:MAG: general secretion pathway protein GspK [Gammaproteobacteria bacterium]|nr:MAG: general secretion pathway protein GspK [Gammaproteobacteria bacterium]